MLKLENVLLYESNQADTGFELLFQPGEITVVLGANQSGKTNLCRFIAGLNSQAQGQVLLDGQDLTRLSPRERPVSMVYQAFINYPNLTVAQNIGSPLRAQRIQAKQIQERVRDLAQRLSIVDLLDRFPHELSGGQQQRVAIARALAKDAKVLLLDEPLVNLDFKLREALELELRDLLTTMGTIVVYTSSDPADAFALGDQLVLLHDGLKLQAGAPFDVYRQPVNATAMALLADPGINVFEHNNRSGALRPEHLTIREVSQVYAESGAATERQGEWVFDMQVTAYETNGSESFVHGWVGGRNWVVRSAGMVVLQPGQMVHAVARQGDVVWF